MPDALSDHPAVLTFGLGVSSADLGSFVEALADRAASRCKGIGDEQYAGPTLQAFETRTVDEMITETLDELADIIAYAAMLGIRVARLGNFA